MKILVINPNTTDDMTRDIGASARASARPDTEIVFTNPLHGPACAEGALDEVMVSYNLVEVVRQAEAEGGYDAYVVACFGDPAVDALREITDKPVVGVAEAAFHLATFLCGKFAIVSTLPRVRKNMEDRLRHHGVIDRVATIRTPDLPVLAFHDDLENARRTLIEAAREAVEQDLAELIILGCAGMSGFADIVSKEIGVPVLDTVMCAVKVAESLVDLGLKTSKSNTYQTPTEKVYN